MRGLARLWWLIEENVAAHVAGRARDEDAMHWHHLIPFTMMAFARLGHTSGGIQNSVEEARVRVSR